MSNTESFINFIPSKTFLASDMINDNVDAIKGRLRELIGTKNETGIYHDLEDQYDKSIIELNELEHTPDLQKNPIELISLILQKNYEFKLKYVRHM